MDVTGGIGMPSVGGNLQYVGEDVIQEEAVGKEVVPCGAGGKFREALVRHRRYVANMGRSRSRPTMVRKGTAA